MAIVDANPAGEELCRADLSLDGGEVVEDGASDGRARCREGCEKSCEISTACAHHGDLLPA
jgi:hypothetical protein